MEAKDICVSFKTAKALHDAGIVVDTCFYWAYWLDRAELVYQDISNDNCIIKSNGKREFKIAYDDIYPAPTAEELLLLIPDYIEKYDEEYWLLIEKCEGIYRIYFEVDRQIGNTRASWVDELIQKFNHLGIKQDILSIIPKEIIGNIIKTTKLHRIRAEHEMLCMALAQLAIKLKEVGYGLEGNKSRD